MLKLTLRCSRCSKVVERDVTGTTLNNDMITKFGFTYLNVEGKNKIICNKCYRDFCKLQEDLREHTYRQECEFFKTCKEEEKNGNSSGKKNGRR